MEKKFVPENHFPIDGKNVIIRKRMKEIRTNAGKTQAQVAEMMHIDRSVYAKYETGALTPSEERIQQFAEIFSIRPEELEKAISAVIPDTSALMKNKRLLTTLLEDFDQVIIPDTVLSELDYQKDHGKNRNAAWQVMMTIDEYRSRFRNRMLFENSERLALPKNDSKIIELARTLNRKLSKRIYIIHDDIGMTLGYGGSIRLKDYIAKRAENTNYPAILALDEEYEHLERYEKLAETLDLNAYLPDGMTLLISCIRCNDRDKAEGRGYPVGDSIRHRKMKFLLDNGANPDKTDNSRYCLTPLSHCVQIGDYRAFSVLLGCGADYNKGSIDETTPSYLKRQNVNEGNTPLMIACWHGRKKFVEKLCAMPEISLNQQDSNGYTALIKCAVARYNRKKEGKKCDYVEALYRYLLKTDGVDTRIRDRENRTAKDWWDMGDALEEGEAYGD